MKFGTIQKYLNATLQTAAKYSFVMTTIQDLLILREGFCQNFVYDSGEKTMLNSGQIQIEQLIIPVHEVENTEMKGYKKQAQFQSRSCVAQVTVQNNGTIHRNLSDSNT